MLNPYSLKISYGGFLQKKTRVIDKNLKRALSSALISHTQCELKLIYSTAWMKYNRSIIFLKKRQQRNNFKTDFKTLI